MFLKSAVSVLAVFALATGGYFLVKEQGVRSLSASLTKNLEGGDYLAALAAAGKLKDNGQETPELSDTIAKTARLLVAEDIYKKAKQAADQERWVDARALLSGSEAVTDSSFKYYQESKKILADAEALAAGAAHKTAVTISTLEEKASAEKKKRETAEQKGKTLEDAVQVRDQKISEAQQLLSESQKNAEAKQTELVAEQARAKALMEAVEKESRSKFFNELRTYRDMVQKGKEQLDNAIVEINAKRDVTALIYVSQGKILFEEAKSKAADFRANRTPAAFEPGVADLVRSLDQFLESAKQLRNAVVYIEDQSSADFTNAINKGKSALSTAASYLSNVTSLIAANP